MKAPHYIFEDTGASDHTIGLFARMQVVVSMRLHALVFSAGQGSLWWAWYTIRKSAPS